MPSSLDFFGIMLLAPVLQEISGRLAEPAGQNHIEVFARWLLLQPDGPRFIESMRTIHGHEDDERDGESNADDHEPATSVDADPATVAGIIAPPVNGTAIQGVAGVADHPEKSMTGRLLTEGIVVLVATAASYAVAYRYEAGFAEYYGIPNDLVVISIQNILWTFTSMIALGVGSIWLFQQFAQIADMRSPKQPDSLLILILKRSGLNVIAAAFILYFTFFDPAYYFFILVVLLLPIWLCFLLPLTLRLSRTIRRTWPIRTWGDYRIYWRYILGDWNRPSKYIKQNRWFFILTIVCASLLPILIAGILGRGEARRRSSFPFIGDTDEAVLRRYGDILVIGKFEPGLGELAGEYRVSKVEDLKDRLIIKRIGVPLLAEFRLKNARKLESERTKNSDIAKPAPAASTKATTR